MAAQSNNQFDQDVLKDMRGGFDQFVRSGQAWALAIGFVFGYVLRGFTSF
ncbi:hypothetical protein [Leptolyngbya sp. FACHB-261]|nr:hypothetical protein [Leptolyngbya sp. FACHB-261]MBD2099356.1 hypothetical protein [Leptolyngbya sp. FACHB-261]